MSEFTNAGKAANAFDGNHVRGKTIRQSNTNADKLRQLKPFLELANLETPCNDAASIGLPPPYFNEILRLARRSAEERGLNWARLKDAEQEALRIEASESLRKEQERRVPSTEDCVREIFDACHKSKDWRAHKKDLVSHERKRDFEIHLPCDERDKKIVGGQLRAVALRLDDGIFIVAEDDKAALVNLRSLALATRRLFSQMALNPGAAGWVIEIPPRFELLRRDPERDVTRRDRSDPEVCFLAAVVDIDPSRIRRCRVCDQLYAAFRSDQRGCSKECARVDRMRESRRWYERNKEWSERMKLRVVRGAKRRLLVGLNRALRSDASVLDTQAPVFETDLYRRTQS